MVGKMEMEIKERTVSKKVFVGNLSYAVTENELSDLFSQVATVISARVVFDRATNRSRGFGFVEYETDEDVKLAIEKLHESDLRGRPLIVNAAHERDDRSPRPQPRSFSRGPSSGPRDENGDTNFNDANFRPNSPNALSGNDSSYGGDHDKRRDSRRERRERNHGGY